MSNLTTLQLCKRRTQQIDGREVETTTFLNTLRVKS